MFYPFTEREKKTYKRVIRNNLSVIEIYMCVYILSALVGEIRENTRPKKTKEGSTQVKKRWKKNKVGKTKERLFIQEKTRTKTR